MMAHDYRMIAAEIENEIRDGRLLPGARLTPQRIFAYQRGIAISTAGRVYAELRRKNLIVGEVGRGSYVRPCLLSADEHSSPEPDCIDLTVSRPGFGAMGQRIARSLAGLSSIDALEGHVLPPAAAELDAGRSTAARFLGGCGWKPDAAAVTFSGNAREAMFAALSVLLRRGDRLGTEALSFSSTKGIADRLGVGIEPLAMDGEGVPPEEMERAHVDFGVRVFLLQPNLHNPLGTTMGADRKRRVADLLRQYDLFVVEDAVNAFLADLAPLASYAPDRVILVDSLSKRVSPGLTIGMAVSPEPLRLAVARASRSTAWSSMGWAFSAAVRLMEDGTATELVTDRRRDARARQALARALLQPLAVVGDQCAYHLWMPLPALWRSEAFEKEAAMCGVAVSPSHIYSVKPGYVPAAVRLSLGTPAMADLRRALHTVRELATRNSTDDRRPA